MSGNREHATVGVMFLACRVPCCAWHVHPCCLPDTLMQQTVCVSACAAIMAPSQSTTHPQSHPVHSAKHRCTRSCPASLPALRAGTPKPCTPTIPTFQIPCLPRQPPGSASSWRLRRSLPPQLPQQKQQQPPQQLPRAPPARQPHRQAASPATYSMQCSIRQSFRCQLTGNSQQSASCS
jgi:hypothetical protein